MGSLVERRVASGASVDARVWVVLVVFSGEGRLGSLLTQNAELFCADVLETVVDPNLDGQRVHFSLPLLNSALHSSSDFCNGYDMLFEVEADEEKKDDKNGMGIEALDE